MKKDLFYRVIGIMMMVAAAQGCSDPGAGIKPVVTSGAVNLPVQYRGASNLADCRTRRGVTYWLKAGELNWTADSVYCLCGNVRVPAGSQLVIAAGTTVRGEVTSRGSLTVVPTARINAVGTAASPIIFTTTNTVGARAACDWGGVNILGRAQINRTAPQTLPGFVPGTAPTFGSNTTMYNGESSGIFMYVRIECAGWVPDTNYGDGGGLRLCAVGFGTTVDHVQVSGGCDDGVAWYGGTVNAKYLISHKNVDDDFDLSWGYTGKVQYGVASRDPARADASGSNGIESDNDDLPSTAMPITAGILSNFTLIGPVQCTTSGINSLYLHGISLRRYSNTDIHNSVVVGWPRFQFMADATITSAGTVITACRAVRSGVLTSAIVSEPPAPNNVWGANPAIAVTVCPATNATNGGLYRESGLPITAWTLTAVNFTPMATSVFYTSPLLAAGANANTVNAFFDVNFTSPAAMATYFIGARRGVNENGWNITSGWVNWQPETVAYPNDGMF